MPFLFYDVLNFTYANTKITLTLARISIGAFRVVIIAYMAMKPIQVNNLGSHLFVY